MRPVLQVPARPQQTRRGKFEQAGRRGSTTLGFAPRESSRWVHACKFGMEAIPNCANERKIPSKNEQANSSNDHTFAVDTFRAPVKKMAFVIVFWTTDIPFVLLVLPLAGGHAMRALRSLRFARLLGGDGAPTLSTRRSASAYVSCRSLSTSRLRADRRDT